ncbi:ABC transporter ATP-binding protein [Hyphomicrobium sp. CS1BSMeth3]|uniref:ABC transporter ATP-binding protein n=1 Tax=Hyphomicrobium sp. CS1BSMeth3 TaxID=1892844 RepID=UPI0009308531|nr:ABC transporter ATP-binding protein [Hyphomicrobium sp. CS1BSMeth3]
MAFIDIAGIDKRFGSFKALSGIELAIEEREFVTFLGPSGCGKTTMLRTLAGFLTPDSGTIHVGGKLLSSPQAVVPPEHRRMGMVFQNYAVWPHMSVFENVAFGLRLLKVEGAEIGERVSRILDAVGLRGLEKRHPGQLSGGQQQRVALARSLVVEPSILLLDEPLSNLDAKLRERMRTELKTLQRRTGITFIYVTHDQAEAMALSDRIVVFNQGTVQQVGAPRDVYERPANIFVADFMGLVNKVPGKLVERRGTSARVRIGEQTIEACTSDGIDPNGAIVVAIRPEAIRLGEAAPVAGNNVLAGKLVESTFLGNIVDHQVDVSGSLMRVQGDRQQAFEPGANVNLIVPITECVAMQGDTSQ